MDIEWSAEARADLARHFELNLGWSFDWAERVERRLYERVGQLRDFPRLGEPVGNRLHKLSAPDIGFIILYELDTATVSVVSVWNARENRPPA